MQLLSTPVSPNQSSPPKQDRSQDHILASSICLRAIDFEKLSPRIKLSRTTTASELLAAFKPVQHPSRAHSLRCTESMATIDTSRDLRVKERVSYTISDDSASEASPSGISSLFPTPKKRPSQSMIDLDQDSIGEIETPKSPPPRISSAGHKLRPHRELHLSLRAQENSDKPIIKKRKLASTRKTNRKSPNIILKSDANDGEETVFDKHIPRNRTARNEIRDFIATETAAKRSTFFTAKKDFFLPLLPASNHISRLVEKEDQLEASVGNDDDSTIPYEAIDVQPKG